MLRSLIFFVLFSPIFCLAQQDPFQYGQISVKEVLESRYEKDTTARAVYLNEVGEAYFDSETFHLIFKYYAKIKILKADGLDLANIEVPLYKDGSRYEKLTSMKASSFNFENGKIQESSVNIRDVIIDKRSKYWERYKLVIPNVKVGTVIEIYYEKDSPYVFNFHPWTFQSDIPKVRSVYRGQIPGTHVYNITLKGYLKLSKNESEIVKTCIGNSTAAMMGGGYSVDCTRFLYEMDNIPAFIEEDYMTAKKNFISAIQFELSEYRNLNGGLDKITKEWKDAEMELKQHEKFGGELRKSDNYFKDEIAQVLALETSQLNRAKRLYAFVQSQFEWDGENDLLSNGIKEALEKKKGSSADIILFLIAAMRRQGFDADPVILSTRDNGVPNDMYPVLTDYNYVICRLIIEGQQYLLDATEDFNPFGTLPERCLNGKGRLLNEKASAWVDLKPAERGRNLAMMNMKLGEDGIMRGTIQNTFAGYEAIDFRKHYYSHKDHNDYVDDLKKRLPALEIKKVEVKYADEIGKAVVQQIEVEIETFGQSSSSFNFNPFILSKWSENPFKSTERLYPVDFGAPLEMTTIFNLEYPAGFEVINLPEKIGLALPNAGGRYMVDAKGLDNRVTYSNSLIINKSVYSPEEYHYLKELFNKVVEVQNADLLFRKKS